MQKHLPVEMFGSPIGSVLSVGATDIYYQPASRRWVVVPHNSGQGNIREHSFHKHLAILSCQEFHYMTGWLEGHILSQETIDEGELYVVDVSDLLSLHDPNLEIRWRSDQHYRFVPPT